VKNHKNRGNTSNLDIQIAKSNQAEILTQIAFAAKRHWGYPERWIQLWSPILTINAEFIDTHETFVAYLDDKPIEFFAISKEDERASVEHLWVFPDFIGRGVGADLFKYMMKRCNELGVQILEIESDPNAQGFYERMGAKKVGEIVSEVDGQPRVLPLLEIPL
jgi:GNAT superfamily N-acetyltransferase